MKCFNLLFLTFISIQSVYVLAQGAALVPAGGSSEIVGDDGVCRKAFNSTNNVHFVPLVRESDIPTNSNSLPAGISTGPCGPTPVDGVCGASHGGAYSSSAPSGGSLCNTGSSSSVSQNGGTGAWQWSCLGSGGGNNASCATGSATPITGSCGQSDGAPYQTEPPYDQYLCDAGNYSTITRNGTTDLWEWSCEGAWGGGNDSCSTGSPGAVNGSCGQSDGAPYASEPPYDQYLCDVGDYSTITRNGTTDLWEWTCDGTWGGATASCSTGSPGAVNGACGQSDGQPYTSQPPYDQYLCDAGNNSTITQNGGTGFWEWTCEGIWGGSDDSCSTN